METDKSKRILMVAYHYPPILHINDAGINAIVNIENKEEIKSGIYSFIENINTGTVSITSDKKINTYSREHRTKEFDNILNSL